MCARNRVWEEFASACKEVVCARLCLYVCLCICACVEHRAVPSWSQQLQLGRSAPKLTTELPNPLNSPSDDIEGSPSLSRTLLLFSRRIAIVTLHLNAGISISWRHAPLHQNCMSKAILQREEERGTFQTEKKKETLPGFLVCGLVFGWLSFSSKKSAARRYWSNISVSLVSTAIHLFIPAAEPDDPAAVLTGISCFMDHIGNSKDQQSSCYLTFCELSHPRQMTSKANHLWTELTSHLSLFKWAVFPQVQMLDFWCLACNVLLMCGIFT